MGGLLTAFVAFASTGLNALGVSVAGQAIIGQALVGALGVGGLGRLALGIGLEIAARSLIGTSRKNSPSAIQREFRQPIPPRCWTYGRAKISGPIAFLEPKNGSLHKIVLLQWGEYDAIEQVYLNDLPVTIDDDAYVITPPYAGGGYARLAFHSGTDDQTVDPAVNSAFPDAWTADHRLRGIAYTSARYTASTDVEVTQSVFPTGSEPDIAVLARWRKLYDPRKDSTVAGGSGSHRIDDKSTWEWSENSALCVLDYLIHPDGYARPASRIDLPSFVTMADLCDEAVLRADGSTEARYVTSSTVYLTENRKDVLRRLLEACDGELYPTSAGKWAIRGGKWEEPTVTLDHDAGHIIGIEFEEPDALDRYNQATIQFLSIGLGYVENEADPWEDVDDIAVSGEVRTQPLDYTQVPSFSRARRLAKIKLNYDNPKWLVTLQTNLAGLQCIGERVVRLRYPEMGIDGPYWIDGLEIPEGQATVSLKLRSAKPGAYDWTPAEEGASESIPDEIVIDFTIDAPAYTVTQAAGPSIQADWAAPTAVGRSVIAEYRAVGGDFWIDMVVADTDDQAISGPVAVGSYEVRLRLISGPAAGPWSDPQTIQILDAPALTAAHWMFMAGV